MSTSSAPRAPSPGAELRVSARGRDGDRGQSRSGCRHRGPTGTKGGMVVVAHPRSSRGGDPGVGPPGARAGLGDGMLVLRRQVPGGTTGPAGQSSGGRGVPAVRAVAAAPRGPALRRTASLAGCAVAWRDPGRSGRGDPPGLASAGRTGRCAAPDRPPPSLRRPHRRRLAGCRPSRSHACGRPVPCGGASNSSIRARVRCSSGASFTQRRTRVPSGCALRQRFRERVRLRPGRRCTAVCPFVHTAMARRSAAATARRVGRSPVPRVLIRTRPTSTAIDESERRGGLSRSSSGEIPE